MSNHACFALSTFVRNSGLCVQITQKYVGFVEQNTSRRKLFEKSISTSLTWQVFLACVTISNGRAFLLILAGLCCGVVLWRELQATSRRTRTATFLSCLSRTASGVRTISWIRTVTSPQCPRWKTTTSWIHQICVTPFKVSKSFFLSDFTLCGQLTEGIVLTNNSRFKKAKTTTRKNDVILEEIFHVYLGQYNRQRFLKPKKLQRYKIGVLSGAVSVLARKTQIPKACRHLFRILFILTSQWSVPPCALHFISTWISIQVQSCRCVYLLWAYVACTFGEIWMPSFQWSFSLWHLQVARCKWCYHKN